MNKATNFKGKTALGYMRVTTEMQRSESSSLLSQKSRIQAFCEKEGVTLLRTFMDTCAGMGFKRPEFREMMDYICENIGTIQFVLVTRFDRFSRDHEESVLMKKFLNKHGITIHAIDDIAASDSLNGILLKFPNEEYK